MTLCCVATAWPQLENNNLRHITRQLNGTHVTFRFAVPAKREKWKRKPKSTCWTNSGWWLLKGRWGSTAWTFCFVDLIIDHLLFRIPRGLVWGRIWRFNNVFDGFELPRKLNRGRHTFLKVFFLKGSAKGLEDLLAASSSVSHQERLFCYLLTTQRRPFWTWRQRCIVSIVFSMNVQFIPFIFFCILKQGTPRTVPL